MNEARDRNTITLSINKSYLYLGLGLLLGAAAGVGVTKALQRRAPAASNPTPDLRERFESSRVVDVAIEGRPSRGPDDAPVTLVEFTDYECPFCSQHYRATYGQLVSEYGDKLKYVVRNFPIPALHPRAQSAAEAAECAYDQGRFWEYHDLLFERAPALDVDNLEAYAEQVGLDSEPFAVCLTSGRKSAVVMRDIQDGIAYGVTATPTFFINGRRLVGALPLADFASYIDQALEEVEAQAATR